MWRTLILWIVLSGQSLFSQALTDAQLESIARGFHDPWIGWQELCTASLPLEKSESTILIGKLENIPGAWQALTSLHEKNQQLDKAIQTLSQPQLGEEHTNKPLWRCRLLFEQGNLPAARQSLADADQFLHDNRSPYEREPIFVPHSRIAFSLGKLDSLRSWLEWILTEKCSALMQWKAYADLRDLDYHQQKKSSFTPPRWMLCMIAAEEDSYTAHELLAAGKDTWWSELTWDQRCLLCESINNKYDLAASLLPDLSSLDQEQRCRILTSLQSIYADKTVLMSHLFKDRDLYKKLLPDLIDIQARQLVTGRALARLAMEESSRHPYDLERATFMQLQGGGFGKINLSKDVEIWKTIQAADIKLPEIFNRESLSELNYSTRLVTSFFFSLDEKECTDLIAMHPQSALMPKNIHAKMNELKNFFKTRQYIKRPTDDTATRELHDSWRILQMYTAPDIARVRPVLSYFYQGAKYDQWYFFRFDDRERAVFTIGSPIQNNEVYPSRHIVTNPELLAWDNILRSRITKNSPLDNQIFLSQQITFVRNEKEGGLPRENYSPSAIYPDATRALMELQCNELYPNPAKVARPHLEKVLAELPLMGNYLHQCTSNYHGFGNIRHLLEEHVNKNNRAYRPSPLPDRDTQMKSIVVQYLLGESISETDTYFQKPTNIRDEIPNFRKFLNELGCDENWKNSYLMAIFPEDFKIEFAPAVLKKWPDDSAAFNVVMRDATKRYDGETICQLLITAINQPVSQNTSAVYVSDVIKENHMLQLIATFQKLASKGVAQYHLPLASSFFEVTITRYPKLTESAIESLFTWFTPIDHKALEEQLSKLCRDKKIPSEQLGKYQTLLQQTIIPASNAISKPLDEDKSINEAIELNWGLARMNGRGNEVTPIFEKTITKWKLSKVNYDSVALMRIACRHASDAVWADFLAAYLAYDHPIQMMEAQAIEAAQCYFDGCEIRATQWLDAMTATLRKIPAYNLERYRYSSHTIAAKSIATAWIWIGNTEKADQLTEWLKPLSDQPAWDAYLRRNEPLGDQIGLESALTRNSQGNWNVHWTVSSSRENFSSAFGMWPVLPLEDEWKLQTSIRERTLKASPMIITPHNHNRQRYGTLTINRSDREFDGEIRLVRQNQEWSDSFLYGSGETKSVKFTKAIALAPLFEKNLKQKNLKITSNQEKNWVKGDQWITGWLPPGGYEILTFDAEPGDIINLSGFYTGLTNSGVSVLALQKDKSPSSYTDSCYCHTASIDWFTEKPSKELSRVSSSSQTVRLSGPNEDGSGFIAMRMIDAMLEFHQTIVPAGIETLAVFPGNSENIIVSEQHNMALAYKANLIFSCPLNPKEWPRSHTIGASAAGHIGFTRNAVCVIDNAGLLWIARPQQMIFRNTAKIDPLPKIVVWNEKGDQFATSDTDYHWKVWKIDGEKIQLQGTFNLPESQHFRFSDDSEQILLRNLRDKDVYELLDLATGKTSKQSISNTVTGMKKYYRDGYPNWISKEKTLAPMSIHEGSEDLKKFRAYIRDWHSNGTTYSDDGQTLYLIHNGVVRRTALPEFSKPLR